ncbi:sensor histidine kinase [Halomicroarcula sp. GCM10025894]|uniref:sensor histidine kinase n=1 Tax=Halomicroarcula sp. GCM10025894 TaxID=3252673 RepID=UPI00361FF466
MGRPGTGLQLARPVLSGRRRADHRRHGDDGPAQSRGDARPTPRGDPTDAACQVARSGRRPGQQCGGRDSRTPAQRGPLLRRSDRCVTPRRAVAGVLRRAGGAPALDSGLAWEAYQSGDAGVYPDVRAAAGVFDAETPFRSELLVPLGEYGVFIVAAQTTDEFTDTDVTLAKLLAANATVALDQVTTESLLAQQRDNLELLTRMMSHDIRNDLQVVGAIAEILGENVDGTQQEYVEKIRRNTAAAVELTTSAQELVEAMLRTETEPCPVSLRESLEDQLTRVTETATDATITVDGEIPDVTVLADEMLGSVFRNVLKNAVQHNREPDPTVTVTVEADETVVRVKVADNGPGIPDDRKESIFGRGERGMSSDGTGIGLYLVETLVDQYGGHVWVEDRERSSAGSRPPADDNDPTGAVFVIELQRE